MDKESGFAECFTRSEQISTATIKQICEIAFGAIRDVRRSSQAEDKAGFDFAITLGSNQVQTLDLKLRSLDPLQKWGRDDLALETVANTSSGKPVVRIRGRCYHALVNCPREIRKLLTVEYQGRTEPMVTVDMSSTYTAILVGQMWDSPERTQLQELLATKGFYSAINGELSENQRYADYAELKRQFQKQCLFWRDPRLSERPLWQAMRKLFPQLARYIETLRQRLGVTGLSDHLMEAEAALFIDNVLVRCDEKQIPCVPIHDALLVPTSVAGAVKRQLETQAYRSFGFVPGFKIA